MKYAYALVKKFSPEEPCSREDALHHIYSQYGARFAEQEMWRHESIANFHGSTQTCGIKIVKVNVPRD